MTDLFDSQPWRTASLRRVLETGHIAEFFKRADAHLYIGEISVRAAGKLDVAATAHRLRLPIQYDAAMLGDGRYVPYRAVFSSEPKPRVELRLGLENEQLVFGHEVGHHFLEDVLGMDFTHTVHNDISESFCEFFGTEMATPGQQDLVVLESQSKAAYHLPDDYEAYGLEQLLQGNWSVQDV